MACWAAGAVEEGALGGEGGVVVALVFFKCKPKSIFRRLPAAGRGENAAFGPILAPFPPPGGGPGRLREVIFGGFVRGAAREAKKIEKSLVFVTFWVPCSMLFLSSVACLAACFAASRKWKEHGNLLVFVGRKT